MDGARPSRFAAVVDPVLPAVNGDGRPIVKVVFVAGATGKQGGSVARFLLAYRDYGWHVKCLTRNLESPQAQRLKANGAEVVEGRLEDRPRMEQLLRGVHSAFLNTTHDIATGRRGQEAEVQQGQSFVDAAVAAGVKFLVYSALPPLSGNEEARPKLAVQQYIRKKGVPYCWVVPAYYAENFIDVWPPTRDLRGRLNFWMLPSPEAGNVVMPHTSMDDFGGVVRGIMKQHVEYIGRSVLVVSDVQPLKFFMAALAAAVLEPVDVAPIPKEAFRYLPLPCGVLDTLERFSDPARAAKVWADAGLTPDVMRRDLEICRQLHPSIGKTPFRKWAAVHSRELRRRRAVKLWLEWMRRYAVFREWFSRHRLHIFFFGSAITVAVWLGHTPLRAV